MSKYQNWIGWFFRGVNSAVGASQRAPSPGHSVAEHREPNQRGHQIRSRSLPEVQTTLPPMVSRLSPLLILTVLTLFTAIGMKFLLSPPHFSHNSRCPVIITL